MLILVDTGLYESALSHVSLLVDGLGDTQYLSFVQVCQDDLAGVTSLGPRQQRPFFQG